jgi:hypothetical protein
MGVGGNDVYGLFANPADLANFLAGLEPTDRAELVAVYRRIARRKDNEGNKIGVSSFFRRDRARKMN